MKNLCILGTRGIPATHGGFETFAEKLALYLVSMGWKVSVYCQTEGSGPIQTEVWKGVQRIMVPSKGKGTLSTIIFDMKSILHANSQQSIHLTLGYNTAIFNLWLRLNRHTQIINMDGIEWKRSKYSWLAKTWLYLNEKAAIVTVKHWVADHPQIALHLSNSKATSHLHMIPYGADSITQGDKKYLKDYGLTVKGYVIIIARPEPENSILEMVRSFSRKKRGIKLLVLGNYSNKNDYQSKVLEAASDEVVFPGGIYATQRVQSLRFYCLAYLHGHQVGGTNPSLLEAMGAGNPVLSHQNRFNDWVTGKASFTFSDENDFSDQLDRLIHNPELCESLGRSSLQEHSSRFTWEVALKQYQSLLLSISQKN